VSAILQPYIGKEIEAKIIELDKNRKQRGCFSPAAALGLGGRPQSEVRSGVSSTSSRRAPIRKGWSCRRSSNFGRVSSILAGVDGLVHVSRAGPGSTSTIRPRFVKRGATRVTVEVGSTSIMDRERGFRLSLQGPLREDPWRHFSPAPHAIGQIVGPGKVTTKLVPFGAFVPRFEGGHRGSGAHLGALGAANVEVPDQVVQVGDDAMGPRFIDIDLERRPASR